MQWARAAETRPVDTLASSAWQRLLRPHGSRMILTLLMRITMGEPQQSKIAPWRLSSETTLTTPVLPRPTSPCNPNKGPCRNCAGSKSSPCKRSRQRMPWDQPHRPHQQNNKQPCRISHPWRPLSVCMPICPQNGLWHASACICATSVSYCGSPFTGGFKGVDFQRLPPGRF